MPPAAVRSTLATLPQRGAFTGGSGPWPLAGRYRSVQEPRYTIHVPAGRLPLVGPWDGELHHGAPVVSRDG